MRRIEQAHQIALIEWAAWVRIGKRKLSDYLWHTPNGGIRTKAAGGVLKAMGMKAGIPDLQLGIAVTPYHGLFIEMKSPGEPVPKTQRDIHELLREEGYRVEVCFTIDEAKHAIERYLQSSKRLFTEFKPDKHATSAAP